MQTSLLDDLFIIEETQETNFSQGFTFFEPRQETEEKCAEKQTEKEEKTNEQNLETSTPAIDSDVFHSQNPTMPSTENPIGKNFQELLEDPVFIQAINERENLKNKAKSIPRKRISRKPIPRKPISRKRINNKRKKETDLDSVPVDVNLPIILDSKATQIKSTYRVISKLQIISEVYPTAFYGFNSKTDYKCISSPEIIISRLVVRSLATLLRQEEKDTSRSVIRTFVDKGYHYIKATKKGYTALKFIKASLTN
eukprot:Anaeramoba_ignava/a608412_333.p2 GENE.a608412_333~~a608412_333.p2  ORF type:complete len:254 (-),score=86.83 a608412_333:64-825(-)